MGMKPRKRAPNKQVTKPESASPDAALRRAILSTKKGAAKKKITSEMIDEWSEDIGAIRPVIRVAVKDQVFGILGHFDFLPSLKDIKSEFGTGKFKLIVYRPSETGSMVYATCRTIIVK